MYIFVSKNINQHVQILAYPFHPGFPVKTYSDLFLSIIHPYVSWYVLLLIVINIQIPTFLLLCSTHFSFLEWCLYFQISKDIFILWFLCFLIGLLLIYIKIIVKEAACALTVLTFLFSQSWLTTAYFVYYIWLRPLESCCWNCKSWC